MIRLESHFQYISEKMKSKDMQTAVKHKYENGDHPTKNYRDLGGVVPLRTIQSWFLNDQQDRIYQFIIFSWSFTHTPNKSQYFKHPDTLTLTNIHSRLYNQYLFENTLISIGKTFKAYS
jgi:hypothetical protein